MAIVKFGNSGNDGGSLERRVGIKAAKKAAKHPAKKHPGKKHPGKKAAKHASNSLLHAETHDPGKAGDDLAKAFHHLRRAGAVISLLGQQTGGDLRILLDLGIEQYRAAAAPKGKKHTAKAAQGLLRAAEHLALAALYSARITHLDDVAIPETSGKSKELRKLRDRLDHMQAPAASFPGHVQAMARELLHRAEAATGDMHLEHELAKAVDGLCSALEEGL